MSFADHFSDRSESYAHHRPTYPPELADWLASLSPSRGLAWEAGCGSGQLTRLLAGRFRQVRATDASARQLAGAPPHPRVEYRRALASDSGLDAATVDLAVAAQAAHWFDLDAYWAEVRRVAVPGAAVALVTYGLARVDEGVDRVIDRFYHRVLGPHWPPERRHVESGYRALSFPFPEVEPPQVEMREDRSLDGLLGYVETWSGVGALERAGGGAEVERLRLAVAEAWGPPERVRTVRWPLAMRVGRVG